VAWHRWIDVVAARLRALAGLRRADDDLDDELSFHVAMQARANQVYGMTAEEAARQARIAVGGVEQVKERSREGRPLRWAQTLAQDVRYALRSLRRSPGFAAVALLTLALGIGANAAMFTIVNGVLLRPLPYPDADSLVRVYHANPRQGVREASTSLPDVTDWRAQTPAFSSMAGFFRLPTILTGHGDPRQLDVAYVTGEFFGTLATPAQLGRPLDTADHVQAQPRGVISDRLWRTTFSADPAVIGSTITVRAGSIAIVGVMPAGFRFPTPETDLWMPESVLSDAMVGARTRANKRYEAVARLRHGISVDRAQADLSAVAGRLAGEHRENEDWSDATVVPLRTVIVGDVDRALIVVFAVVGLILLIGCANLANLLMARGASRAGEIAVRTALGAGRMRIVRQMLTESLVLAALGGALGMFLGAWTVNALVAASADTLPRIEDIRVDAPVLGFAGLLVLLTSLLFGALPAIRVALAEPLDNLRGTRGVIGRGQQLRGALVAAEVALTVLLAIGAGLMARSFLALRTVDPGFKPEGVLTVGLQLNIAGVPPPQMRSFIIRRRDEIIDRLAALPGVIGVGSIDSLPLRDDGGTVDFTRTDGTGNSDGSALRAEIRIVHPDYFRAMGIPLLKGEPLPREVAAGDQAPVLVSETAARRFWPGGNPIGQLLRNPGLGVQSHVIGVVGDVHQIGLAEAPRPAVYVPQAVAPNIITTIAVRTTGDPLALAGPIRQLIREIDPNQPVRSIEPLTGVLAESIARDRFFTVLFVAFGGLALVLAAIGIYGVVAYSVGQRTQEIGLRMTLGARRGDVLRMVVGKGMRPVLIGMAIGVTSAIALTRVLASQLYGISATDPAAFAMAVLVLISAAALACYVPARRAVRIDPIAALRSE
jgi:predicted permease